MKVTEIVIACFNLEGMLAFYQNVFGLSFKDIKIPQGVIYESCINELKITLCPATLAGITAKDNRLQLTFLVLDIKKCINEIEKYYGKIIGGINQSKNHSQVAIKDIDNNSIVLIQKINK